MLSFSLRRTSWLLLDDDEEIRKRKAVGDERYGMIDTEGSCFCQKLFFISYFKTKKKQKTTSNERVHQARSCGRGTVFLFFFLFFPHGREGVRSTGPFEERETHPSMAMSPLFH